MKKLLVFAVLSLPFLAQASFKERQYQCHWYINPSFENGQYGLMDTAYVTLKGNTLDFQFDFQTSILLELSQVTPKGTVYISKKQDKIANDVSILYFNLEKEFFAKDTRSALSANFDIVSRQTYGKEVETVTTKARCHLLKEI